MSCSREDTFSPAEAALKLLAYCRENDWAGHDPYDALNSRIFELLPVLNAKWPRLLLTQALKRSPVNLRRWLGVPMTQNPKALGLFLKSQLKLARLGLIEEEDFAGKLVGQIAALRSPGTEYWCWGYSFPWQTRTILVPRGAPNLVCTTFVAGALLDAYDDIGDAKFLEMATSAGDYILKELYYTEDDSVASFSYPMPGGRSKVHNANFLAAALLGRLFQHTGDQSYRDCALRAARYSASKQKSDGSWEYGELSTQKWIDNFHTGYNLSGLRAIGGYLGTSEFEPHVRRGFEFYRNHFFRPDGAPRYFHDRTYPIDSHCVAQSILTLIEFQDLDADALSLARRVYGWAIRHMYSQAGFFYYRVLPAATIRTSYLRWSQAWMLLALSALAEQDAAQDRRPSVRQAPASITA